MKRTIVVVLMLLCSSAYSQRLVIELGSIDLNADSVVIAQLPSTTRILRVTTIIDSSITETDSMFVGIQGEYSLMPWRFGRTATLTAGTIMRCMTPAFPYIIGELYTDDAGVSVNCSDVEKWATVQSLTASTGNTLQYTDSSLIIPKYGSGTYTARLCISFSGSGNSLSHSALWKSSLGTAMSKLKNTSVERSLTANQTGSVSASGIVSLAAGDTVRVRMTAETVGSTYSINHLQFNLTPIPLADPSVPGGTVMLYRKKSSATPPAGKVTIIMDLYKEHL